MDPPRYDYIRDEQDRDLADYTLRLAFLCFGSSVLSVNIIGVFRRFSQPGNVSGSAKERRLEVACRSG